MPKRAAPFYSYPAAHGDVYGQGRRQKVAELTDLYASSISAPSPPV